MRQAGIIAAGALYAIENHRDRLTEDHANAARLGDACQSCGPLAIRGGRIDTNIVICELDPEWGTADRLVSLLRERGVSSMTMGVQIIRFVTHLDVNESQIDEACQIIQSVTSKRQAASV